MSYTINPQKQQDSITAFLEATYPHVPIIPDGMLDTDDDTILKFADQSIKPFVVLWFNQPKRSSRGRSFGSYKLDSRFGSVDVVVVARKGTEARELLNSIQDSLVGFKTDDGGRLHESSSLWGSTRSIDIQDRPTRFTATTRFDFGVSAVKVDTP